jgi:hypothetical protein
MWYRSSRSSTRHVKQLHTVRCAHVHVPVKRRALPSVPYTPPPKPTPRSAYCVSVARRPLLGLLLPLLRRRFYNLQPHLALMPS